VESKKTESTAVKHRKAALTIVAALLAATALLSSCKAPKDKALEAAINELGELKVVAQTLNPDAHPTADRSAFMEYSARLVSAKVNIELALNQTKNEDAKRRIRFALDQYVDAQKEWQHDFDADYRYSTITSDKLRFAIDLTTNAQDDYE
jgi:hypothetical protein